MFLVTATLWAVLSAIAVSSTTAPLDFGSGASGPQSNDPNAWADLMAYYNSSDALAKRGVKVMPDCSKIKDGLVTAGGLGRYPKLGITGCGYHLYECGDTNWRDAQATGGCRVTNIVESGKCIQLRSNNNAHQTVVMDSDLICTFHRNKKCELTPVYTKDNLKDYFITKEEEPRFLGKPQGMVSGVSWPGVETFDNEWGRYWRINIHFTAPNFIQCWRLGEQVGL